ncbi:MAG TPA: hypothetical protein VM409_07945, partial [Chloroflexia bacterium]|nr:hypothetical protein [Chloroflexia bacterium]
GKLDFTWASLFAFAAALILGVMTPVRFRFEPYMVETVAVVIGAGLLLGFGLWRRNVPVVAVSTFLLFATIVLGIITQPTTFSATPSAIWPLRLLLITIVVTSWALFLAPPGWMRRAMLATALATSSVLLVVGGPALLGQPTVSADPDGPRVNNNFSAYFLAINSRDDLFAGDLEGGLIWVFDPSGNLQGTIRPSTAPPVPTPGPGIVPRGLEFELNVPSFGRPSPTPSVIFSFCGMAIDAQDNLYLLDIADAVNVKLMRFNRDGNITARWSVPPKYQPTNDCLATDANHIYLNSAGGRVFALDFEGKEETHIDLPYSPWAMATYGGSDESKKGQLLVTGPGILTNIEIQGSKMVTSTLPPPPPEYQFPMHWKKTGELLLADHQQLRAIRWDPQTGKVLGTIGGPGLLPGQFGDLGGFAEDSHGRLYVADTVNRVIQRFGTDGKIDAVWSALDPYEAGERR